MGDKDATQWVKKKPVKREPKHFLFEFSGIIFPSQPADQLELR
jgi:hypothetical protein